MTVSKTAKRATRILAAVAVGVVIGLILRFALLDEFDPAMPIATAVAPVAQVQIGGPFTLVDHDGRTRNSAEFEGKLMLVFFGYTNCPDVCPVALQNIADALDMLGPDAERATALFVTVDPGRDRPQVLKAHVEKLSDRIIGLTGTPEQLAEAAKAYRVYYKLAADAATNRSYTVDHTSTIYLMNREGRYVTHLDHATPPERIAAALRIYL